MNFSLNSSFSGRFKIEAVRSDGSRRLLADWFSNIITDIGLDRIGQSNSQLGACHVGSGTAVPAAGDTALGNRIATTTNTQATNTITNTAAPPYYVAFQNTFRFPEGVAAGNLSEVGVGWTNLSPFSVFSRALILDSNGDPTSITVLSNEVLDVTYELRHYPPLDDATGTVNISGTSYNWTARARSVGTASWIGPGGIASHSGQAFVFNGPIGPITGAPGGATANVTSTPLAYTAGSFQRDTVVTANLSQGNVSGGITSVSLLTTVAGGGYQLGVSSFQIEFDPPIPKTLTTQLSLTFRRSWGRASI